MTDLVESMAAIRSLLEEGCPCEQGAQAKKEKKKKTEAAPAAPRLLKPKKPSRTRVGASSRGMSRSAIIAGWKALMSP